jgi:hypothetical protein
MEPNSFKRTGLTLNMLCSKGFLLHLLCSLVFVFAADLGFGQVPIPDNIKKTVTFLFASDGTSFKVGTGFYLEDESNSIYLVTAKHVLQTESGNYLPRVCMRVNTEKGGSILFPIQLSGPTSARVFVHSNPDVDIAMVPAEDIAVLPKRLVGNYDFFALSVSLLATKDHFREGHVQEGDEVFFTGWFRHYYGANKNYPIVRFGRLAMTSDEKIPWGNKMLDLYLIEAHVSGGNSGSPVFFRPTLERKPGTFILGRPTLLIAGVLKGYFGEPFREQSGQNSGIAAVVPASQLREILVSDEVKRQRASAKKPPQLEGQAFVDCLEAEAVFRKTLQAPKKE